MSRRRPLSFMHHRHASVSGGAAGPPHPVAVEPPPPPGQLSTTERDALVNDVDNTHAPASGITPGERHSSLDGATRSASSHDVPGDTGRQPHASNGAPGASGATPSDSSVAVHSSPASSPADPGHGVQMSHAANVVAADLAKCSSLVEYVLTLRTHQHSLHNEDLGSVCFAASPLPLVSRSGQVVSTAAAPNATTSTVSDHAGKTPATQTRRRKKGRGGALPQAVLDVVREPSVAIGVDAAFPNLPRFVRLFAGHAVASTPSEAADVATMAVGGVHGGHAGAGAGAGAGAPHGASEWGPDSGAGGADVERPSSPRSSGTASVEGRSGVDVPPAATVRLWPIPCCQDDPATRASSVSSHSLFYSLQGHIVYVDVPPTFADSDLLHHVAGVDLTLALDMPPCAEPLQPQLCVVQGLVHVLFVGVDACVHCVHVGKRHGRARASVGAVGNPAGSGSAASRRPRSATLAGAAGTLAHATSRTAALDNGSGGGTLPGAAAASMSVPVAALDASAQAAREWVHRNLHTVLPDAPRTRLGGGAGDVDDMSGTMAVLEEARRIHVYYIDAAGSIHELVYMWNKWAHHDLFAVANRRPPAAQALGRGFNNTFSLGLLYMATNGIGYHLAYRLLRGWYVELASAEHVRLCLPPPSSMPSKRGSLLTAASASAMLAGRPKRRPDGRPSHRTSRSLGGTPQRVSAPLGESVINRDVLRELSNASSEPTPPAPMEVLPHDAARPAPPSACCCWPAPVHATPPPEPLTLPMGSLAAYGELQHRLLGVCLQQCVGVLLSETGAQTSRAASAADAAPGSTPETLLSYLATHSAGCCSDGGAEPCVCNVLARRVAARAMSEAAGTSRGSAPAAAPASDGADAGSGCDASALRGRADSTAIGESSGFKQTARATLQAETDAVVDAVRQVSCVAHRATAFACEAWFGVDGEDGTAAVSALRNSLAEMLTLQLAQEVVRAAARLRHNVLHSLSRTNSSGDAHVRLHNVFERGASVGMFMRHVQPQKLGSQAHLRLVTDMRHAAPSPGGSSRQRSLGRRLASTGSATSLGSFTSAHSYASSSWSAGEVGSTTSLVYREPEWLHSSPLGVVFGRPQDLGYVSIRTTDLYEVLQRKNLEHGQVWSVLRAVVSQRWQVEMPRQAQWVSLPGEVGTSNARGTKEVEGSGAGTGSEASDAGDAGVDARTPGVGGTGGMDDTATCSHGLDKLSPTAACALSCVECRRLAVERAVSIVVPRVVSATRTLDVDVLGRPAGGVTARITHVSDLRAELLSAGDLFSSPTVYPVILAGASSIRGSTRNIKHGQGAGSTMWAETYQMTWDGKAALIVQFWQRASRPSPARRRASTGSGGGATSTSLLASASSGPAIAGIEPAVSPVNLSQLLRGRAASSSSTDSRPSTPGPDVHTTPSGGVDASVGDGDELLGAGAVSLYGLDAGVPTLVQVELQHLVAPASEECVGRVELELLYWPAMGQRTSSLRGRPPSMSTGSDQSLESSRVPLSGSPQAAAVASAVGGNWPAGTSRTLARHLPPQLPLPVRHAAASSHGGVATMRHRANTYSAPRRGSPAASEHARRAQRAMAVSTRARASHARASSSRVSSMSPVHLDLSGGTSGGIASSDDEVVTAGNRVVHDELESIL